MPHDLRHTAASLAISSGANSKAVQRMLGHKSAAMTLDACADLFEDLEAVAVAMNEAAVRALAQQRSSSIGLIWHWRIFRGMTHCSQQIRTSGARPT